MPPLVKAEEKVQTVREMLTRMVPQLALACASDANAKRMARIAMTSCLATPKLLDCDPRTLAGAVMEAAQIGLEPDGHEAHLVPFYNGKRQVHEVQLIPDYKGLCKLARQSGEIKALDFRDVRKGDEFKYKHGSGAFLTHVPADESIHGKNEKNEWVEKRPITHCYAFAILDSGEMVFEVMRWEDVEWHRDRYSRAAGQGPWITNPDIMGAKTCVRKLSKKLPRSTALQRASELDEKAEQAIPQDLGAVIDIPGVDGEPTAPTGSKLDKLTEELKARDEAKKGGADTAGGTPVKSPGSAQTPGETSATSSQGGDRPSPAAPAASPIGEPIPAKAGKSDAPPAQPSPGPPTSAAGAGESVGAPRRAGGTPPSEPAGIMDASKLSDRLTKLRDTLGISGTKGSKGEREYGFLWGRYVGQGVSIDQADPAKLQELVAVLEKFAAQRRKR